MIRTNTFESFAAKLIAAITLMWGAMTPRPVRADPPEAPRRGLAQQLFDEGRALMTAGRLSEACPKFQAAAEYSQTPGVRLNLARCWTLVGRTASAWAMYAEALTFAERDGDAVAAEAARKGQSELAPKLSYLAVAVPENVRVAGLQILRDRQVLAPAAWGTEVPVDPGPHRISAEAPGRTPWVVTVDVASTGGKRTITVPKLEAAPEASIQRRPVAQDRTEGSGELQRTLALVSLGAGVVGVGVGSYFGIRMISKKHEYDGALGPDGQCASQQCETASHDAYRAGTISTIAFAAGGAFLATGAALWLTAPSKHEGPRAELHPIATPRTAGLALHGSF